MKITRRLYRIIFLIPLLCVGHLCWGADQPNDPLKKTKHMLLSDEFSVNTIATQTTDANRAEVVTELKQVLSEGLNNSKAEHNNLLLRNAVRAYAEVTREDSATVSATLQPLLSYPDPDIQALAARFIAKSGDPSALGRLKPKLLKAESNLPDISSFTAQTEQPNERLIQRYFQMLFALDKIKTPGAAQLRDESLARFKAKYQGTDSGQKLIDAYMGEYTKESQRPDKAP
jgi:hypothetical protein